MKFFLAIVRGIFNGKDNSAFSTSHFQAASLIKSMLFRKIE